MSQLGGIFVMTIYHNYVIDISNEIIQVLAQYHEKIAYAKRIFPTEDQRAELDEVEKFIETIIEVLENA